MSFSVRVMQGASALATVGTHMPFVSPSYSFEYTQTIPPILSAIVKSWTVKGKLYGTSEVDVNTQWASFVTALQGGLATEIQLLRGSGPGTVVDNIGGASGYDFFRTDEVTSPQTDLQWRGEMEFTLKVSGRKRVALLGIGSITKLDPLRETYAYDEAGLLTHSLEGELEVASGNASDAAALMTLSLPGGNFGYTTLGPSGVEYEILDRANTRTRFRCEIKQNANTIPGNVGPSYSVETHTTSEGGLDTTTKRVQAYGAGAAVAVGAADPGTCYQKTITTNGLLSEGIFVTVTPTNDGQLMRVRGFALRGGGKPVRWTRRTGGKDPAPHFLPRTEVEVIERCIVEVRGAPGLDSFRFPPPINADGIYEDTDAQEWDPFLSRTRGATRTADIWTCGLRRVYRCANVSAILTALGQAALALSVSSTPTAEMARKGGGGK